MRKRGFSLAEVIIAGGILAVVVVMVTNLMPSAVLFLRSSEHRMQAGRLCHKGLETARSTPFQTLAAAAATTQTDIPPYQVTQQIAPVPGVPGDKLLQITVRVTWTEFEVSRSLEMLTYVSSISRP